MAGAETPSDREAIAHHSSRIASRLAARLLSKLAAVADDVEDVQATAATLAQQIHGEGQEVVEVRRWLQNLCQALDHLQLECADAQFSARQLRDQLPDTPALQLRLLE